MVCRLIVGLGPSREGAAMAAKGKCRVQGFR